MAGADEEDDDFPATQPVMSVLLSGVVAYVEVRSGHDNRSKGVKAHMRSLGATIQETLNRKVTHVVFNEGLPSTYKKAKKFKCHLVSVLWIEACKEALTKVSEAGYPPIGQQIYENPDSIKNFKKMKSMQPDSDDDAVEMKTKKRLKRMARRQHKNKLATVPDASEESDEDGTKKTSPPKVHEQPGNETSKKSTRSKAIRKKPALQEITPEVVNKSAVCEASGANSAKTGTTQNMKPLLAAHAQGCSTLPQNKAGLPGKKSTKSKKLPDNSPITRREFIEGLNDICLSLPSDSDMDKSDVSPWRKSVGPPPVKIRRKNPPAKKVSPRRSPRHASDSSDCFLFPAVPARRSPRHVTGIVKISKKEPDQSAQKPSACTSASAALLRKKMPVPPSSPGDDFVLLSQEPGDMPSIDEMAKMRRGSVRAGNERITLSQIIRSYNAVAQEGPESAASTSARSRSASLVSDKNLMKDGCNSPRTMEDTIVVDVEDDAACDMEVRSCVSRCSSEAGSTVSSTSTRVLINGNPSSQVGCSSSYLPSSGTVDDDGKVCTAEEPEREPSPIFVIKKSKFRRPLKKQFNATKQSSENQSMDKNIVSLSNIKNKDVSSSAEERRPSLNPIDYINKLLLPKFMPVDRTPGNAHMGTVIVEDTPELVSSSNSKTECHCVIPPTPVGNQEPVASPNQSLTSSVISWVKKSCRVPLFSSHSKKAMATTPTIQNRNQNSPKEMAINPGVSSQDSAATIYYSFSKETGNAPEESENPLADLTSFVRSSQVSSKNSNSPLKINQPSPRHSISEKKLTNENSPNNVNKSLGEQQSAGKSICKKNKTPPAISKKGEILQDQAVQNGSKSKASSLSKKTKVLKPRGKVIVTVVKNDEGVSNSGCDAKTDTASLTPVIQINKAQEAHCSSGYETSNSIASDTDTAGTNKNRSEASDKRKKITDWLSPISGPPKKQSDIYEYESPASRDTDKSTDTMLPQRRGGRKRIQSVPDKSSKKPKLNSSESDITPGSRRTRASRVDGNSVLTESRSDLSTDSTKSSGRKSSEEAKKRMAVSLTRNYKSHALKVIVCTFLTASEQNGIDVAGTKLGGWKLEEKVTPRTTHVINSGPKRTLNMLKGLSRGCWLVDQQWMLDSAKAGTWLDEEKYELTKFSPGVKLCRMKRQAIGKEYKHNLFARSGPIFVSPKSDGPPAKDIRELLELCGADLTTSMQEAKIVVGGEPSLKGTLNCVRPQWVLDSITRNKVLPMNDPDYQIK